MVSFVLLGVLLVFFLAVLGGLWIGVLGHGKAGRGGAWWSMLAGLALLSFGVFFSALFGGLVYGSLVGGSGSGTPGTPAIGMMQGISFCCIPLGSLLFATGFALNGLKSGRVAGRVEELEQVSSAMGEEITRLNSREPGA